MAASIRTRATLSQLVSNYEQNPGKSNKRPRDRRSQGRRRATTSSIKPTIEDDTDDNLAITIPKPVEQIDESIYRNRLIYHLCERPQSWGRMLHVNGQLPYLNLTAADGEKYPDFCGLLSDVSSYINKDGLSHQTLKDLNQAEEVLRREKHGWLLNHILYQELQELHLDYELKSLDISLSSRDQQFYSMLRQCLTRAEVADYLDFSPDPSSKVTALGLTREELERQSPHKKHMQSLQQVLIPELEERLRKKCENLVLDHDPQHTTDSSKLMFAKSSQLPAMIESDIQNLKDKQSLLKEDYWRREKQFSLYYQKLEESLQLLERLISKYKLQKQTEHDTIITEWLFAKCDAMSLKIRLIELQILCDTYTVDTVQSLRIIRKHLDDEYKERDNEKLHREQALKTYLSMGEDFNNIVTEFGKLKDELDNKQWALKQFDKSKGSL